MKPPFVRTTIEREVVESTSDLARERLLGGQPPLPMLIIADLQTAGRGRGEHSWWSDEGSLTFTLALDPAAHGLRAEHEPRLALAAAVAIVEMIEAVAPLAEPAGIRWPNDVEAGGRKLAGILPERLDTPAGPRLLLGIGLNVRTRLEDAPAEVREMAGSIEALRRDRAGPIAPRDLLGPLLDRIAARLDDLARDDPGLADRWAALDTLAGREVRVDLGGRVVRGSGLGIDGLGGLRLATGAGAITLFGGRVLRG